MDVAIDTVVQERDKNNHNNHNHNNHHKPFCSLCYLFCVAFGGTLAVAMSDRDGGSSAMRRRQRRLRSWLRHVRQTVTMELAAALHHSRDARSEVAHEALRGHKTASSGSRPEPLQEVSEPQVGAVTVGYVAVQGLLLSAPMLADTAADTVDACTMQFLLQAALLQKKKKEVKERRSTIVLCVASRSPKMRTQRGGSRMA